MGLTGPSSLENVHRTFSRALGPPKGKAGDGRVMDSEIDHICHGPSGRDRCGRFCTALLVTPKASPPQWGGGPKGRWGTPWHGGLPAQTIEQGSATAMWARAAVLVWKASRRDKGRLWKSDASQTDCDIYNVPLRLNQRRKGTDTFYPQQPIYSSNICWACSRVMSTSRGLEPSASDTMPRRDISSMMRPARA